MNPAGGRATEILMTSKDGKDPAENQGARKPRGMGGVILILAVWIDMKAQGEGSRRG